MYLFAIFFVFIFRALPSLLEYFSYNFCFMTLLAGPTTTYREYNDFITGHNMIRTKQVR